MRAFVFALASLSDVENDDALDIIDAHDARFPPAPNATLPHSPLLITAVMHRDLSTRNVLVHALHADQVLEVWVKVSDFGLSCLADSSLESVSVRRDRCHDRPPQSCLAPLSLCQLVICLLSGGLSFNVLMKTSNDVDDGWVLQRGISNSVEMDRARGFPRRVLVLEERRLEFRRYHVGGEDLRQQHIPNCPPDAG